MKKLSIIVLITLINTLSFSMDLIKIKEIESKYNVVLLENYNEYNTYNINSKDKCLNGKKWRITYDEDNIKILSTKRIFIRDNKTFIPKYCDNYLKRNYENKVILDNNINDYLNRMTPNIDQYTYTR